MTANTLRVKVYRINDGVHESAALEIEAHTVSVNPDELLDVKSEAGSKFFSSATWTSVEIERPGVTGRRNA